MINLSKDLIGNHYLIENLKKKFLEKKLSNSLIFSGQKGIGKATAAFYFIDKIYEELKQVNRGLIYKNTHPNIRYLSKNLDEKTNKLKKNITIDQIRELEIFLNQSSFDNLPKFIIIDSAEDLNINASNSLLKSLEEPNNNTFFILISHQFSSILPTIRSRCLNYVFEKPTYENFSKILKENRDIKDISDINFLYYAVNASSGLAYEIYSDNIYDVYTEIIQIFIDNHSVSNKIINLAEIVSKYSNNEFKNFLILFRFIVFSFIKINLGYNFDSSLSSHSLDYLTNSATSIPNSTSLKILEFLNENEQDLFIYNLDKKIFFFNIFSTLH